MGLNSIAGDETEVGRGQESLAAVAHDDDDDDQPQQRQLNNNDDKEENRAKTTTTTTTGSPPPSSNTTSITVCPATIDNVMMTTTVGASMGGGSAAAEAEQYDDENEGDNDNSRTTMTSSSSSSTTKRPTMTANQPPACKLTTARGRRLPSMGTVLKYFSLFVLVVMLGVKIIYTRFATVQPHSQPFLKTALVFWSEVAKFLSALFIFVFFTGPIWSAPRRLYDQFTWVDTLKLGVPAFVYTVQNFLFLVALENLEASTFSVLDQMKILTTALFTVIILRRRLSLAQWSSLIILMVGVIIVQYNAQEDVKTKAKSPSAMQNGTSTELLLNRTHALTAASTSASAPLSAPLVPMPSSISPALRALRNSITTNNNNGTVGGGGHHQQHHGVGPVVVGVAEHQMSKSLVVFNVTTADGLTLIKNGTNGTGGPIVHGVDKQKLKSFDPAKQRPLYGLVCVILGNFASGFAGVYVEKMLKSRSAVSIWLQNVQLAVLAMPISLAMVALQDWHKVWHNGGLNQGFDLVVWGVVVTQTMSGLCIAVVIKYADNILKTFANSFAIIGISVASIWVFGSMPNPLFIVGAALIITAALLYAKFPYRAKPTADRRSNTSSSNASSTTDTSAGNMDTNANTTTNSKMSNNNNDDDGTTLPATANQMRHHNNHHQQQQQQVVAADKVVSRLSNLFRMDRSPTMAQLTPLPAKLDDDDDSSNKSERKI